MANQVTPYYEQDGMTIYHADCRDVLPSCDPVDLLLTDPPYGLGTLGSRGQFWGKRRERGAWDIAPFESMDVLLSCGLDQIIWGGNYYTLPPSRGWLVWWKRDSVQSAADCELAWTSFDMNTRLIDQTIAATNAERVGHPAQKPEQVILWCLGFAPNARTVIDPFMGSGTTLVAAKRLGRKAIGIEIEERYCEMAAKRLRQGSLRMEFPA